MAGLPDCRAVPARTAPAGSGDRGERDAARRQERRPTGIMGDGSPFTDHDQRTYEGK
jgi:hypothetical protein